MLIVIVTSLLLCFGFGVECYLGLFVLVRVLGIVLIVLRNFFVLGFLPLVILLKCYLRDCFKL